MVEALDHTLLGALDEVADRFISPDLGAHHQCVDEESDKILELLVGAPSHVDSDAEIVAGPEKAQGRGQASLNHDEVRRGGGGGYRGEGLPDLRRPL